VTLAVGRDFADVSPMRGVIQGGAAHELSVAVTVAPPEEWDQLAAPAPALQATQSQSQSQTQTPA